MSIESDPTKIVSTIRNILLRAHAPKPIQEIADEINKSYDDTFNLLQMIDKTLPLKFSDLPEGKQAVVIASYHKPKFR